MQNQTPPQLPHLFIATPESLLEDAQKLIDTKQALLDRIAATVTKENATFANTVLEMAKEENKIQAVRRKVGIYNAIAKDPKLREASAKVTRT